MPLRVGRTFTAVVIALTFVATIAAYVWFMRSPHFETFMVWAHDHETALIVALVLWKIAAIVWPPIPGSLVTFGAIPIVGWLPAYLADFAGSFIGSALAFWIAYHWGARFVAHLLGETLANKLASIRIPPHREFEAVFVLRVLGAGLVEAICYAAGLLRLHFGKFMAAIALSHATLGLPAFYFGREVFTGKIWTSVLLVIAFLGAIFLLRKRYLTTQW